MNNAELRARAKSHMTGYYKQVIIINLIIGVVSLVLNQIGSQYQTVYNMQTLEVIQPGNPALLNLINIVSSIITALFLITTTKVFIKVVAGEPVVIEKDLFFGFTFKPVRTLIASFLQGLFIALWSLLLLIPGLIKAYSYAMTQYLIVKTEIDASDTITRSKQLMHNHKMQLFLLDLSYLPEYLLGIFTFGILWLWTASRHETARILFFNEIYSAGVGE